MRTDSSGETSHLTGIGSTGSEAESVGRQAITTSGRAWSAIIGEPDADDRGGCLAEQTSRSPDAQSGSRTVRVCRSTLTKREALRVRDGGQDGTPRPPDRGLVAVLLAVVALPRPLSAARRPPPSSGQRGAHVATATTPIRKIGRGPMFDWLFRQSATSC